MLVGVEHRQTGKAVAGHSYLGLAAQIKVVLSGEQHGGVVTHTQGAEFAGQGETVA